jgi:hypothetical protein
LDELEPVTHGTDAEAQAKAVTATAHSILVLAEQVAAIRVLIVSNAGSRSSNGQPAAQAAQPAPQAAQPAPRDETAKKRRWW